MFQQDLISIIMPTYNSEKFVCDAISSVLKQTYQNWELLLIDDCSTDNTIACCNFFDDARIHRVALPKNGGAGPARNEGLKRAKGSFIAFLDADDIWLPNKLEKQVQFMRLQSASICHTSYTFIDENGAPISGRVNASKSVNLKQYMRTTEIGLSTAMVSKIKVGDFFFKPMRLRQDTRLWIDLLNKNHLAQGLNEPLTLYRVRQGQISGNKLKAVTTTLRLYLSITDLPLATRLTNYLFYLIHAILKRM